MSEMFVALAVVAAAVSLGASTVMVAVAYRAHTTPDTSTEFVIRADDDATVDLEAMR